MSQLIALTDADKRKLTSLAKKGKQTVFLWSGFVTVGALVVAGGFILTPQAVWPSVAVIFVVFFSIGIIISLNSYNKIQNDLRYGMKKRVSGAIASKAISRGNQKFGYDPGTLAKAALRVEEEETGKPITRYGVIDQEIDQASALWYNAEIDKVDYDIGVRNYLIVEVGDQVELEVAPKSGRVLAMRKI